MPNHFHGILWILDPDRTGEASAGKGRQVNGVDIHVLTWPVTSHLDADASPQPPKGTQPGSLNAIIQNFKSISTRKINQVLETPGNKIWQRDYFERVIRDERELNAIRQYIQDNPLKWELDQENPAVWAKHPPRGNLQDLCALYRLSLQCLRWLAQAVQPIR